MTSVSRRYGRHDSPYGRPSGQKVTAPGAPVVLMVSGGADSSALLLMAATSALDIEDGRGTARIGRERLHVLHVNHLARGMDSTEDEEFVVDLAGRFGIPVTVVREDVPALVRQRPGHSFEEVARDVRYEAARLLANDLSRAAGTRRSDARILTAHTSDDRVETFFMNALRGSGPSGLSAIPRRRNRIVRPLLDRAHEELCDVLRMHGIIWREDATNDDPQFLRNYVRHELVAPAKARNPQLVRALSTTCDLLSDEDAYLTGVAARTLRECRLSAGDGFCLLDAERLSGVDVAIARRIVRDALLAVEPHARLEARHVNRALELTAEGEGSFTAPMGVDVACDHGVLALRARRAQEAVDAAWLDVPGRLRLASGAVLEAQVRPIVSSSDPVAIARAFGEEFEGRAVMLDADALGIDPASGAARLWVASASTGLTMQPLGMGGRSKRVSDVLSGAGIARRERSGVPVVLTEPMGRMVWVCGLRADERSRVTGATRALVVLRITGVTPWLGV